MELAKGQLVEAKVRKVDNQGLFLDLDNGIKAYLPKQNMHIGKKKKLTEIFSEGYNLSAKVLSKKKDYYVLTQKEAEENQNPPAEKKTDKKNNKKEKKQGKTQEKKDKKIVKEKKLVDKKEEEKETPKSVRLEDLKNLKTFGSMKISVQKKKEKVLPFKEEKKEEEKILLTVPQDFIENLEKNYEENIKKLDSVLKDLRERGHLDED